MTPYDLFPSHAAGRVLHDWRGDDRAADALLRMRDGVKLHLRFSLPDRPDPVAPLAVVLHGAGMHSGYYQPMARMLANKGVMVATVDQRGHGQSEGRRGDIDHPEDYCRDLSEVIQHLAQTGLKLAIIGHSGAAAMALKVLARNHHPAVTGLAMMTPTFADDGGMVRRSTGGRDFGSRMRYNLRPAAEPAQAVQKGQGNTMGFNLGRFILYRLTRLQGGGPVLTYVPSRKDEVPYTYSARGVQGSMVGAIGPLMQGLRLPVFLATGGQDQFVNSDAVRMTLPWFVDSTLPLSVCHDPRGDHFTTLLLMAPRLGDWILALPGLHERMRAA